MALLVLLFEGPFSHRRYIGHGIVLYDLAKLAEVLDVDILEWTAATVSGHTLKHLLTDARPGFAVSAVAARRQQALVTHMHCVKVAQTYR